MTVFPKRKSPRANWHPYEEGTYFITICTNQFIKYFGEIKDGQMTYTKIGYKVKSTIENVVLHFPNVSIHKYVIMPNHCHLLLTIGNSYPSTRVEFVLREPLRQNRISARQHRPMLSVIISSLKGEVKRYATKYNIKFKWQSRYHDAIVRDTESLNLITHYIEGNVENWCRDKFYS